MRILIVVAALLSLAVAAPSFNGYQFMGRGFDIAYASMRPLDIFSYGTSFGKFNVFQADTDDDIQFTPSAVYQADFVSTTVSSSSAYSRNSSSGISVSAEYEKWGLSGQASADFGKWNNAVNNQSCEYYTADILVGCSQMSLIMGRQAPSFVVAAAQLPTDYVGNELAFINFIKKFGTHYIVSAILGGRQNFWTIINTTQLATLGGRSAGAGISVNSRKLVNATIGGQTQQAVNDGNTLANAGVTTHVYAFGGDVSKVTNNKDFSAWSNSVIGANGNTPVLPIAPITMTMQHYIDLIPDASRSAMRQALVAYHEGSLKDTITPDTNSRINALYNVAPSPVYLNSCATSGTRCSGDVNTAQTSQGTDGQATATSTSDAHSLSPVIAALFVVIVALLL